jgi:hypothetical protein
MDQDTAPEREDIGRLIEKIKSGEIYGELQLQLEANLKKRSSRGKKNQDIDSLQSSIQKKEDEITKLIGEIIRLKNELSFLLEKELEEENR